jgi:phospholipid/cholesterol/gamma-HCH transport system substrate-binding protein
VKINFERWGETILGAIVAVVAVGFFVFAAAQAGASGPSGGTYNLVGSFQRVDGINVGSDVRISGVKIGVVRSVELDPSTYNARLTLALNQGVEVLDESTATIASDGLLGGAYVSIEPSGMDVLAAGAEIPNTRGSVDLLTLFASFAQGQGGDQESEDTAP